MRQVRHWDGSTWQVAWEQTWDATEPYWWPSAIWGAGPDEVWAAGSSPALLRWDGLGWVFEEARGGGLVGGIASPDGRRWVFGDGGLIAQRRAD